MLSDTTRFTGNYVCFTDIIQQRSFTVVYVSHHSYDRRTCNPVFFIIIFFISIDGFNHLCTDIFCLETKFVGYDIDRLRIQALVDGNHDTDTHTSSDNLCHRYIHHIGKVVCRNELGQFQYFAFLFLQFHQFMLTFDGGITFITTVLGTFVILVAFIGQAGKRFLDLLLYILLAYFSLNRLFQTRFATVVTLISRTAVVCTRSIVHIHTILLDTVTFLFRIRTGFTRFNRSTRFGNSSRLYRCTRFSIRIFRSLMESRLSRSIIVIELFAFVVAFFSSLFLCFLLRTGRLVQGSQVNFTGYLDIRLELRSIQPEQVIVFRFCRRLTICGRFVHFFRRAFRRFRLHCNFRFFLFDSFFFHNYLFYFFFLHRFFYRSCHLFFLFSRGFYLFFFRSRSRDYNRLRLGNGLSFNYRLRFDYRLSF